MSPADLVLAAKAAIEDDRDNELARRLGDYGLDPINTARSIMRWKKGEGQPEYPATLALLDIAGLLNKRRLAEAQAEAERAQQGAEARLPAGRRRPPRAETGS